MHLRPIQIAIVALMLFLASTPSTMAFKTYVPQSPDPFTEPWRWTMYPEIKGHGLRCLDQTTDGSMWFGTDDGVWQYNGQTWTTYTPQDGLLGAPVYSLCATKDGLLYAGTAQGVSIFKNGSWAHFFPTQGDLAWPINELHETNDGNLWASTSWGALHLSATPPRLYTSSQMAQALAQLVPEITTITIPDHIVPKRPWLPTVAHVAGVGMRATEGSWATLRSRNLPRTIWALAPNSPAANANMQIGDRILAIDNIQPAWVNDALKGPLGTKVTVTIQRKNQAEPVQKTLTRSIVQGNFQECPVYTLREDPNGVLYFALARGQIIRTPIQKSKLDPTKTWHAFTQTDSFKIGYAPTLLQAQDGTLWATSQSGNKGLYHLQKDKWINKVSSAITGTSLIQTREGSIWAGGRTLSSYQNQKWQSHKLPNNVPHNYIRLLESQDGAIWLAGSGEGVARFDYQTPQWQTFKNLSFYCDTPDGTHWFLTKKHQLVSKKENIWRMWEPQDGIPEVLYHVTTLQNGHLLVTGRNKGTLTFAIYDGNQWHQIQNQSGTIKNRIRNAIQTYDGSIWFYAAHTIGVYQYTPDGQWHHHIPPEAAAPPACFAQTPNGHIWIGGWYGLRQFDPKTQTWSIVDDHTGLTSYIDVLHTDEAGNLWVGTRLYGIFYYDGQNWTQHTVLDGIADINTSHIISTSEQSIWAVTRDGISRYDGQTWLTHALPLSLARLTMSTGVDVPGISQAANGAIWLNTSQYQTACYKPDQTPPETRLTFALSEIPPPGNTTISWAGQDSWKITPDQDLQYSYRHNNLSWSPFTTKTTDVFLELPSGKHTFEVRARDRDFNIDPTPAIVHFTVIAPVWQRPWFIFTIVLLLSAIAFQTRRVIQRNAERALLSEELRQLQYLYRLRVALGQAQTPEDVIQQAGQALQKTLSTALPSTITVTFDDRTWTFGVKDHPYHYQRHLFWADQTRGKLTVNTGVILNESQERALLDETAGQIMAALEARELEAQLLQSARLLSLGQMAAGVAHELNQPLAAISATAEGVYLRLESGLSVSHKRLMSMMDDILGLVDRMIESINNLRIFSRDSSQEPGKEYSINDTVRNSVKMMDAQIQSHGIELGFDLAQDLPLLEGHPHQIEQVILNLLGNARDALDDIEDGKKKITIRTRQEHRVQTKNTGDELKKSWIILDIQDNGPGIEEAHLPRLFEPFFTTKPVDKGTGIGLSIAFAIVKNHGGEIFCISQKNQPTTFRVALPITEVSITHESDSSQPAHLAR